MMAAVERVGPHAAADMAQLHARCFARPWPEREFASLLHLAGVTGYRLGSRQDPQGLVLARQAAGEAEILTLGVCPELRGRGLARALLGHVEAKLAAAGVGRVILEVSLENSAARALYAAAGYREVGRRPGYYADGSDALVLEKWLPKDGQTPVTEPISRPER